MLIRHVLTLALSGVALSIAATGCSGPPGGGSAGSTPSGRRHESIGKTSSAIASVDIQGHKFVFFETPSVLLPI